MTSPVTVVWPRRAAAAIEATAGLLAASLAVTLAALVVALARIEPARPLLAVASGFVAGGAARLAKDARELWGMYRTWRRHQLDGLCARRETSRARRVWAKRRETANTSGNQQRQQHRGVIEASATTDAGGGGRGEVHDHDDRDGRRGHEPERQDDAEGGSLSHGATSAVPRDHGRFTATAVEAERFWAKVAKSHDPDGCWVWTGAVTDDGYGRFRVHRNGRWRHVLAHRWAYEQLVGPIPEGHTLDHRDDICRNRACVRAPDHLEPVVLAENIRRAARWRKRRTAGHHLQGVRP